MSGYRLRKKETPRYRQWMWDGGGVVRFWMGNAFFWLSTQSWFKIEGSTEHDFYQMKYTLPMACTIFQTGLIIPCGSDQLPASLDIPPPLSFGQGIWGAVNLKSNVCQAQHAMQTGLSGFRALVEATGENSNKHCWLAMWESTGTRCEYTNNVLLWENTGILQQNPENLRSGDTQTMSPL